MTIVTQRSEQNGVLDADKEIFKRNIEPLELPSDTVLKDCTCGVVGCAAELRSQEDRMTHRHADIGDQVAQAASSPDTELVRLGLLSLGRGSSKYDDYLVALRVIPSRGGRQTLAKIGLDLPDTAAVEHNVYGILCVDYLFKVQGFDEEIKETLSDRTRVGRGVIPLGPGLVLKVGDVSYVPHRWGSSPLANYVEGKSVGQAPFAILPKGILAVDPVPLDEDPYSSGGLQRIRVRPEESQPSQPLFDRLIIDQGTHSITGRPGEGKSISSLAMAAKLILDGKTVAYFDADGNGGRINERLLSMGALEEDVADRFRYYRADGLDVASFERVLRAVGPDLVVLDNLTNLLSRAGIHENDNSSVAGWFNDYADKVRQMGAAALILDHPAKSAGGGYARGGGSKLAEEDLAWTITKLEDFNKTKVGKVKFKLDKANDGEMRPASVIYKIGGTPFVFEKEGAASLTENEKKALEALEDGMSYAEWGKALREAPEEEERIAHRQSFKRAKEGLIEKGRVEEHEEAFYEGE